MINIYIPTLEELLEKKWSNIVPNLLEVINIITKFPRFREYIEITWYNDQYYLPYIIFWELIRYLEKCYNEWDNIEIEKVLEYLWERFNTNNNYVQTLIQLWVLENSCHYKKILPDIVKMMPKNLKELFLKHYSDYLK